MQGSQQQAMAASVKQRGAPTVVTILLGVGPLYVTIHIGVAPPPTSWSTFGGYTGGAASPAPCCTSGVSASHVCGAFRCIGFDGPVQERLQRCILCVCVCVYAYSAHTHVHTHTHCILGTVSRAAQALLSYGALALYCTSTRCFGSCVRPKL